ncbi:glycine zipper 2TM domain-containing protein [Oxalobacteraceae bacterium R-40]|uniref:Glycine zipper 2TM domain-containing protein n=1 Tax=Keguizhuia sedimenti TaxID=3064264 RepID=A0ABU1BUA6_9BURK|nr:glycine zipper 2TM domain-containing protein [Oxalobacteraceae bacterium R-40]
MQAATVSNRIHPLVAGAAASVILVSLVGVAAITGILPSSHSSTQPAPVAAAATPPATALSPAPQVGAPVAQVAEAPTKAPAKEVVHHKTIVHHKYVEHRAAPKKVSHAEPQQYAQAPVAQQPAYQQPVYNAPVAQAPAPAQPSVVGIATGAVVGGLIGNQIGGGNGKKLATVAGVIGGGYLGNEIGKRMQQD